VIRTIASAALAVCVVLAAAPALAGPTDDVRNAMLKLAGESSYEMTFSGRANGMMDIIKPDTMHMRMNDMEMMRVSNATYMKAGARGWRKLPDAMAAGVAQASDRMREIAKTPDAFTATDLGMRTVGGQPLHAYSVVQKDGTKTTVYLGSDGRVRRIETGKDDTAVTFSKFNQIAPIRAPM
jgi:hypothetical protein